VKRGRAVTVDEGEDHGDGLVNTRKFFAGLAMTIMERERSGEDFVDLKGKTIDEFTKRISTSRTMTRRHFESWRRWTLSPI